MKSAFAGDMSSQKIPAKILCLVVGYSFFKSFSPFLSYWVPYLVQVKGLTNFQITNKVLPVYAYATLACTLFVAPACEYVSYKTIIVVGSFTSLLAVLLLRFGTTLLSLIIMEVVVSYSTASYFIYQAYIFFLVTEDHFQNMTGFSQASASMAIFLSAELGQILVLIGISYNNILYISMTTAAITCILAFLLPKEDSQKDKKQLFVLNLFSKNHGFWSIIKATWSDKRLQLLSIWWASALAGFELSLNYGTALFEAINSTSRYNGHVIAIGTALAVLMALSAVYLKRSLAKLGGFVYIFGSVAYGVLCLWLSYTRTLWMAYVIYIIMLGVEKLLICFLYAQCGSLVKNDRYALMFSFNCGLGQAAQVVIQALIEIAKVDIFGQYIVLGCFFMVVGVLFIIPYGMYGWKSHTVEIVSPDDLGPKLSKIEPLNQPLMENETAV
eukprot:c9096_g1_i1 orf=143-1465(-)